MKLQNDKVGLDRITFFSDAIFAIAATLLALNIKLPLGVSTDAQLMQKLLEIWPKYLAYIVSFAVIASFWLIHHRRFRFIIAYDYTLIRLNILLLLVVAFIPFPTFVLSDFGGKVATSFYAIVLAIAAFCAFLLWRYASSKKGILDPKLSREVVNRELYRPLFVGALFLISIVLVFINPIFTQLSWFATYFIYRTD